MRRFSIFDVQSVTPADFRKWALGGTLVATIGYTFVAIVGWWQSSGGRVPATTTSAGAVAMALAFAMAWSGRERAGVALAVAACWLEVHLAFMLAPAFPAPGLLAGPVIVIGVSLLFGERIALGVALASVAITGPILALSPERAAVMFSREGLYWLGVHATAMLGSWGLMALSMTALRRTLDLALQRGSEVEDLIAFAPDGILIIGADDAVLTSNPAAERLLGVGDAPCEGRPLGELLRAAGGPPDGLSQLRMSDPSPVPAVWTFAREGQPSMSVEVTARCVDDYRRQLMLRDVSDRVRADAGRREIEAQLAHSQRLEAIGQLAGGIAHDFNNILMTIGGSAELLHAEADGELRTTLLEEVSAATDRGATLTRQLLSFARRDIVRPAVVDLSALVAQLQRLLQPILGDTVDLYCDLEPDCRVLADVGQVEQVLVNLASNAKDAMPMGGTCSISVHRSTDAGGNRVVRLLVSDEGMGMDAATAARAFEPFFTTKPRGYGTGLGLASVHGIVSQSGGTATIDSAPAKGTTVVLTFPYADAPLAATTTLTRADGPLPKGRATILVADDDDGTRAVVSRALQRAGYRLLLAPDGMQALRHIEADPTGIDLLITDVTMPGLTGPELAALVRKRVPALRVLFISGYPREAISGLARPLNEYECLTKPFSGRELLRRVSDLLAGSAASTASAASSERRG